MWNSLTNILEHFYDGGDCCGACINTDFCKKCLCIDKPVGDRIPNAQVGDGFCNDDTNTADCKYDVGDCCGSCVNTKAMNRKHRILNFSYSQGMLNCHLCLTYFLALLIQPSLERPTQLF